MSAEGTKHTLITFLNGYTVLLKASVFAIGIRFRCQHLHVQHQFLCGTLIFCKVVIIC